MARLVIFLGLLLGLTASMQPAAAYPLGQRPAILTPGACANVTLRIDFTLNNGGGLYCLNGAHYPNFVSMPGASFSRSSAETCDWLDGHVTYAASGQPCTTDKGIAVWESRTNLLTQTANYTGWTLRNCTLTLTAVIAAPDLAQTGYLFTDNATSADHGFYGTNFTQSAGEVLTATVYLRQGTLRYVSLRGDNTSSSTTVYPWVTVDTQAGTVANANAAVSGSSVTVLQNGWLRVSLTWTSQISTAGNFEISGSNVSTAPSTSNAFGNSYVGAGQTFYVWGPQVEAGSFSTPYIPTTTVTVTRAADNALVSYVPPSAYTLGFKWIGSQGTVSIFPSIVQIDDGGNSNRVLPFQNLTTQTLGVGVNISGGSEVSGLLMAAAPPGTSHAASLRVQANSYAAAMDGAAAVIATGTQRVPTTSIVRLGASVGTSNTLNSYLQRVVIGAPVDNSQLQGTSAR